MRRKPLQPASAWSTALGRRNSYRASSGDRYRRRSRWVFRHRHRGKGLPVQRYVIMQQDRLWQAPDIGAGKQLLRIEAGLLLGAREDLRHRCGHLPDILLQRLTVAHRQARAGPEVLVALRSPDMRPRTAMARPITFASVRPSPFRIPMWDTPRVHAATASSIKLTVPAGSRGCASSSETALYASSPAGRRAQRSG